MASRLTVLYGDTGVGKSSVLHAGVARDLRALPEPLAVVVFDEWQDDPAGELEARIAEATGAERQRRLVDTLELGATLVGGEVIVILDGLEEEFLYHGTDAGPGSFLDEFSRAATRQGLRASFLLSIREDALAKLDRFKGRIPNVFGNYLRLEHLDRTAAREAIVGPINRYNDLAGAAVEIEPALVEAVLDEVAAGKVGLGQTGRGGVEENGTAGGIEAPFLQLVMARLWDAELEAGSHVLRLGTLARLGGAEQIVRDHLDGALGSLPGGQQDVAAAIFNHLVTPSGAKIAHDAADLAGYVGEASSEVAPVLSSLATERILRPVPGVRGSEQPRYEIYHDILAEAVLAWRTRHESARQLERVRRSAAKRHRRLLLVAVAAVVLAGAMAGVTIFAFTQRSEADAQARKAQARALDASALSQLQIDPELSLLLAVEAARHEPGGQAEDVLRRALLASRERGIFRAGKEITVARFSPDASQILVAGLDGEARIYDARTRNLLRTLLHGAPITSAAFGRDGRTILTAGADGRALLWSARNGRRLKVFRHGGAIRAAAFDGSGGRIVTVGGHAVKVWSIAGNAAPVWAQRRSWPLTRAVFSPDGSRVAVIGNDRIALLFDAASGAPRGSFDQGDFVKSVTFSPHGRFLVTGGRNKTARIWNVRTDALVHELKGHTQDVVDIAYSPNGLTVATASLDGTARTWNAVTGAYEAVFAGHANAVTSVAFSPDARYLLTASSDRTARVWKNTLSPAVVALFAGDTDAVTQATFSPDGTQVLTASDDGMARLWDPAQPTLDVLAREPGPVLGASYAGSGEIAVAGPGPTARLVRVPDGKQVGRQEFPGTVAAARTASNGKVFAVAAGRYVYLFHLPDEHHLGPIVQSSVVRAIAFSPDGSRLATAGTDGVGRIWTLGGRLLRELKGHRRTLTGIAFSPDGSQVATSSKDTTAKIWDARTGRLLHTLAGHTKAVTSVAFSPDGRSILTASADRDARLWNVGTGQPIQVLRWHFGAVQDAEFSPDGRWIVTVGPQTAQLWQPGVQDPFFEFGIGGPAKALTSAVFDSTSSIVLAASLDGTVRTYRCTLCGGRDELLRLARARLALTGRTLSAADHRRYGG